MAIGCFTGHPHDLDQVPREAVVNADVSARLGEIADRLAKLDNAVDAMAVEVERISEGQRFVTKLLAERGTRGGSA